MGKPHSLKLTVHPSVILWLALLFYQRAAVLLPFLLAAAVHELGHLLALRLLRHPLPSITLSFSGAVMETGLLSYRDELLAAAAGPLASLAAGSFLPLWPEFGLYSVILGLFNLLPLPGLDGGRMLRCAAMLLLPPESASRICRVLGICTGLALWGCALYLTFRLQCGLWPLLLGAMLLTKALIPLFSVS